MYQSKCTLKTYVVVQTTKIPRVSLEMLSRCFDEGSTSTNFKNSIVVNVLDIKCKLFTNLTLHVTGTLSVELVLNIINELDKKLVTIPEIDTNDLNYNIRCVMANWSVKLDVRNVDLNTTLNNLNINNVCISFFLKGKPLINKIKSQIFNTNYYVKKNYGKFSIVDKISEQKYTTITLLLYKSGKCVFSGPQREEEVNNILTKLIPFFETI